MSKRFLILAAAVVLLLVLTAPVYASDHFATETDEVETGLDCHKRDGDKGGGKGKGNGNGNGNGNGYQEEGGGVDDDDDDDSHWWDDDWWREDNDDDDDAGWRDRDDDDDDDHSRCNRCDDDDDDDDGDDDDDDGWGGWWDDWWNDDDGGWWDDWWNDDDGGWWDNWRDDDDGGGVDDAPPDPGVSSGQDNTKTWSIMWILPHGDTFMIDDDEVEIFLNWDDYLVTQQNQNDDGGVIFIGFGGDDHQDDRWDDGRCGSGNGRGNCNGNGGGNGGNGNSGGSMPNSDCGGVWVTPGTITTTAKQIAPNSAVVVGQDPDENGVTLKYHVSITPTVVTYEQWTIVGTRKVACVENDDRGGNRNRNGHGHNDDDDDGRWRNRNGCGHNSCGSGCPSGWHEVHEYIWACTAKEKSYREGLESLSLGASLKQESRDWIENELALAYPGARLLHPDWGFTTSATCTWVDDVCTMNTTLTLPVADPGWYDITFTGETDGTKASPARSFDLVGGEFGVYMMDTSAMTQ